MASKTVALLVSKSLTVIVIVVVVVWVKDNCSSPISPKFRPIIHFQIQSVFICTVRKHVSLYTEIHPLLYTECQQCKKKNIQQNKTILKGFEK